MLRKNNRVTMFSMLTKHNKCVINRAAAIRPLTYTGSITSAAKLYQYWPLLIDTYFIHMYTANKLNDLQYITYDTNK